MMIGTIILLLSVAVFRCNCDWFPPIVDMPDLTRTPCQLIESRNFICDEHWIMADDGYILSAQHIINPILRSANKTTIKPIIVQHGLFGSSAHWLINAAEGFAADWVDDLSRKGYNLSIEGRNLPYLLANLGYDVWLTNSRGCKYSRNHTNLDPDRDFDFWKFSYDQMITYDTPAFIDYILTQTGHETVAWIGHSQGTLVLFGFLSEKPEYSDKISPFIALAPVAFVDHTTTPLRHLANVPFLKKFFTLLGGELSIPESLLNIVADNICEHHGIKAVCSSVFYFFGGYDPDQFNTTRLPLYIAHGFSSTSWWNLVHYGQNVKSGKFRNFDYGFLGNYNMYNSLRPPSYNLGAIKSQNIIFFQSTSDPLSDPNDIEKLRESLNVPIVEYVVPFEKFSHLDFIWSINAYDLVYKTITELLPKYV